MLRGEGGQARADVCAQICEDRRAGWIGGHHDRRHPLTPLGVGTTEHDSLSHGRMCPDKRSHLPGQHFLPAGRDDIVRAATYGQPAIRADQAEVGCNEPVTVECRRGEVGTHPVAGEQDGTRDPDPAVRSRLDVDALQGRAVVDASTAGFRHSVRGDHPCSCRPRAGEQAGGRSRAAEQDGAGPRKVAATVEQPPQLGGHERRVHAACPATGGERGRDPGRVRRREDQRYGACDQ